MGGVCSGVSGCVLGACVVCGGVCGVFGVWGRVWWVWGVFGACVWQVCWAIGVGIARSALLSGYLGKSGHLPRLKS